ncbi:MAG: hypothetical protein JW729_06995 [Bacteroidales bacterium]|nr:hypothetical protein [Bacteroidales bacterium]
MKNILYLFAFLFVFSGCKNNQKGTSQNEENTAAYESFTVKETMQAGGYVYILGEANDQVKWYAISLQEVNVGDVFYYTDPLVMNDFYSKELDRPFDEILFLSHVSKDANSLIQPTTRIMNKPSGKVITDQLELRIDKPEGAISIAQLFENRDPYNGKKVMVRGQVVKFSPEIMNTNWIHLQDGTSFDGKYDLTITSGEVVSVGDVVTFEGKIALDKDFGYGYFYDILIEEATIIK